jgi:hypothetical protein
MKQKRNDHLSRVRSVLTWERNICRAIAAWSLYALFILLTAEGDFFDLSFAQDASLGAMLLVIAALFCLLTLTAAVLQGYETDSWFLLLGATGCVLRWISTFVNDINYKVPVGNSTMQMNSDSTLFLLAVIFAYMLFVLYFLQKNDLLMDKLKIHSGVVLGAVTALGLISATVIGVTTFALCGLGVLVGHKFGARFKNKASLAGGIVLILIGTKILLEHLGLLPF